MTMKCYIYLFYDKASGEGLETEDTYTDAGVPMDAFYDVLRRGGSVLHAAELTPAKRNALLTKSRYACALRNALKKYLVREYPAWLTLEFRKELMSVWGTRFKI